MGSRTIVWTKELRGGTEIDASTFATPQGELNKELQRVATFRDMPYMQKVVDLAKSGCIYRKDLDMIECVYGGKLTPASGVDSTLGGGVSQFHHKVCTKHQLYVKEKERSTKRNGMSQLKQCKLRRIKKSMCEDIENPCSICELEALTTCYSPELLMKKMTEMFLANGRFPSKEALLRECEE